MRGLKKKLALFLAVILLLGTLPVSALEPDALPAAEQETEAETEGTESPDITAVLEDAVVYNLGSYYTLILPAAMEAALDDEDVSAAVGALFMDRECEDLLFMDGDGDFVMPMPDDEPFFPYEVQFQYQGETRTEWFETENDTVTVGGHSFSLALKEGTTASYVEGPEAEVRTLLKKDFTTGGSTEPLTLQQIRHRSATVYELKPSQGGTMTNPTFKEILDKAQQSFTADPGNSGLPGVTFDDDGYIAWTLYGGDRYQIAKITDTIDVASMAGSSGLTLGIIAGTAANGGNNADQNAKGDKILWEITIQYPSSGLITVEGFGSDNNLIDTTSYLDTVFRGGANRVTADNFRLDVDADKFTNGNAKNVTFKFQKINGTFSKYFTPGTTLKIYEGYHETSIPSGTRGYAVTDSGTENISASVSSLSDWRNWDAIPKFTLAAEKDGATQVLFPFGVWLSGSSVTIFPDNSLTEGSTPVATRQPSGGSVYEYEMSSEGKSLSGQYTLKLSSYGLSSTTAAGYISSVTIGGQTFNSSTDIQNLFTTGHQADYSGGVPLSITFNGTHPTTPNITNTYTIKTVAYGTYTNSSAGSTTGNTGDIEECSSYDAIMRSGGKDLFFHVTGANSTKTGNAAYSHYEVTALNDAYVAYGYQTVLLAENRSQSGELKTAEKIIPTFQSLANTIQARTVKDVSAQEQNLGGTSGIYRTGGVTPIDFTPGQPVQYTAYEGNTSSNHRNYWVTFLTKQEGGPKLFVNGATNAEEAHKEGGMPTRMVILQNASSYHDVLVANIGDATMDGLYARLEPDGGELNVDLDPYWSFQSNSSLAAFPDDLTKPTTDANGDLITGELQNLSKVRIVPKIDPYTGEPVGGMTRGILVIGCEGGQEVRIKLTGIVGALRITNASLRLGVKWVPYVSAVQDNSMVGTGFFSYSMGGSLPAGLSFTPAGEIYGVPQEFGDFNLGVSLSYQGDLRTLFGSSADMMTENDKAKLQDRLSCQGGMVLHILDNLDENVWEVPGSQSYGYDVLDPIGDIQETPHFELTEYKDWKFRSAGPYNEFVNFYLDGQLLTRGRDYDAREGSTVITIREQTFRNAGPGTHTIAAEFFPGGTQTVYNTRNMKTSSQNYTINLEGSSGGNKTNSTSRRTGGGGSRAAVSPPALTVSITPKRGIPFEDVLDTSVFLADIRWAYENGLMIGTSATSFAPAQPLSPGAIVTVLARMARVDLTQYEEIEDEEIPSDVWFHAAAVWAKQSGLLPTDGAMAFFTESLQRDQMASMLVKYLDMMGADTEPPAEPVAFPDADQMSEEANAAFQVLYKLGIFRGTSGGAMEPGSATRRGQFAALLHRTSTVVDAALAARTAQSAG